MLPKANEVEADSKVQRILVYHMVVNLDRQISYWAKNLTKYSRGTVK